MSYEDIYREGFEKGERIGTLKLASQIVQLRFPDRASELLARIERLPTRTSLIELLVTAPDADTVLRRLDQQPVS